MDESDDLEAQLAQMDESDEDDSLLAALENAGVDELADESIPAEVRQPREITVECPDGSKSKNFMILPTTSFADLLEDVAAAYGRSEDEIKVPRKEIFGCLDDVNDYPYATDAQLVKEPITFKYRYRHRPDPDEVAHPDSDAEEEEEAADDGEDANNDADTAAVAAWEAKHKKDKPPRRTKKKAGGRRGAVARQHAATGVRTSKLAHVTKPKAKGRKNELDKLRQSFAKGAADQKFEKAANRLLKHIDERRSERQMAKRVAARAQATHQLRQDAKWNEYVSETKGSSKRSLSAASNSSAAATEDDEASSGSASGTKTKKKSSRKRVDRSGSSTASPKGAKSSGKSGKSAKGGKRASGAAGAKSSAGGGGNKGPKLAPASALAEGDWTAVDDPDAIGGVAMRSISLRDLLVNAPPPDITGAGVLSASAPLQEVIARVLARPPCAPVANPQGGTPLGEARWRQVVVWIVSQFPVELLQANPSTDLLEATPGFGDALSRVWERLLEDTVSAVLSADYYMLDADIPLWDAWTAMNSATAHVVRGADGGAGGIVNETSFLRYMHGRLQQTGAGQAILGRSLQELAMFDPDHCVQVACTTATIDVLSVMRVKATPRVAVVHEGSLVAEFTTVDLSYMTPSSLVSLCLPVLDYVVAPQLARETCYTDQTTAFPSQSVIINLEAPSVDWRRDKTAFPVGWKCSDVIAWCCQQVPELGDPSALKLVAMPREMSLNSHADIGFYSVEPSDVLHVVPAGNAAAAGADGSDESWKPPSPLKEPTVCTPTMTLDQVCQLLLADENRGRAVWVVAHPASRTLLGAVTPTSVMKFLCEGWRADTVATLDEELSLRVFEKPELHLDASASAGNFSAIGPASPRMRAGTEAIIFNSRESGLVRMEEKVHQRRNQGLMRRLTRRRLEMVDTSGRVVAPVFGVPIARVLAREKQGLPTVVERCLEYLASESVVGSARLFDVGNVFAAADDAADDGQSAENSRSLTKGLSIRGLTKRKDTGGSSAGTSPTAESSLASSPPKDSGLLGAGTVDREAVNVLRRYCEQGPVRTALGVTSEFSVSAKVVARVLLEYLAELPEPPIPSGVFGELVVQGQELVDAAADPSSASKQTKRRRKALQTLMLALPRAHQVLTKAMLRFFHKVSKAGGTGNTADRLAAQCALAIARPAPVDPTDPGSGARAVSPSQLASLTSLFSAMVEDADALTEPLPEPDEIGEEYGFGQQARRRAVTAAAKLGGDSAGGASAADGDLDDDDDDDDGAVAAMAASLDLSNMMRSGWLMKQSSAFHKRWNQRFFFLKSHFMFYAKTRTGEPMGVLNIGPDAYINLVPGKPLCFNLVTATKILRLQAESEKIRDAWIDAIEVVFQNVKVDE